MNDKVTFKRYEKIFFFILFILIFLSTSHADILETSNHSFIFLESVFTGNFFNFYEFVESRPLDLYYVNLAHYNILTYIAFGVWQLPVYIITKLFSIPVNGAILVFWSKILPVAFFVCCGYMVKKICQDLRLSSTLSTTAALFFLFNPIAFFSPVIMGQYDTFCLFFMLWAISYYIKGDLKKFSLLIGVSAVFKFFSLLAFIPLLLLKEKKILNLLKHSLYSLWLYIPTTLLFLGRTGNASSFTSLMFERILTPTFETTFEPVSIFLFLYALICVFAYFYSKKDNLDYLSLYIPMVVYILLFYGLYWHPQWVIILIPFLVITTFMQKNKVVYWYIDIVLCFGFFMTCFREFSLQIGSNILSGGLFSVLLEVNSILSPSFKSMSELIFSRLPFFDSIVPMMLTAGLFANLIFKVPVKNNSFSDCISSSEMFDKCSYKTALCTIFALGFIIFWLVPSALEYLNAFNII